MGKCLGGFLIVALSLLTLEWFGIVDIPYLELQDFTAGKQEMMFRTAVTVENLE